CALLALSLFHTKAIAIAATAFVSVLIMNRRMYVFFFRQRGFSFALSCIPLHATYYLYSGFSYLYVRMLFLLRCIAPTRLSSVRRNQNGFAPKDSLPKRRK